LKTVGEKENSEKTKQKTVKKSVEKKRMSSDDDDSDLSGDGEETKYGGGGEGEGEDGGKGEMGFPQVPITQQMMEKGLCVLAKTGDGLQHAFIKVKLREMQLTDLSLLRQFPHLRIVDVASNYVESLEPLNSLEHLLSLEAPYNQISSTKSFLTRPYLQALDLSFNKLSSWPELIHPRLRYVNFNHNMLFQIKDLDPVFTKNIAVLELRGNHMTDDGMEGLSVLASSLEVLFLAQNNLTSLRGVAKLTSLRRLHARGNRISSFEGLNEGLTKLEYLNVRENEISAMDELQKLQCLSEKFKTLNMLSNPLSGGTEDEPDPQDGYRLEILVNCRFLQHLDKIQVDAEERDEAAEIRKEREYAGKDEEDE